ncbi:MAG TPA: ClcB-like voltage-gated chloride channel protein [Candidatus Udaeobacter sp.]|jgi:CIC family chloride channel protein|nr:ClcB-like voltage-gated chloride channel protein [Candidatus Udaeobacter sp.]
MMDATNPGRQTTGLNLQTLRRLKFWVWFQEWIRPSELQITLIWAGIIGFGGALCSIVYRIATSFVHKILTGSSASGLVESFAELPLWGRLVVPAIGGLIAGAIIHVGSRFRGQVTTTDYMEAVVLGDGKISARQSVVKSLSALFTNASGGSIGREGPLVQLAAMVASLAGRLQRWTTPRLRLLVACGAAAGIASAYNAPISGSVFVAEIVLGSMAMEIFGPLVFASVIATLTVRGFLGPGPLYQIPLFRLNRNWEIIPYLLLGLASGLAAPWFIRLLRASEKWAGHISAPVYVKMCVGGLIVGALAMFYPEVCGNGYSVVNEILGGQWLWQTLALVLIFKVLATAATFGSGAVGGVFTPTLFVGASLGFLFGTATQHVTGSPLLNPSAFAIVGMGAFLAAATHAPIMAIVMIFELTLDYQIILPLMLACVVGYYTSVKIEKHSIYAEALKRKGAGDYARQLAELHVRDLMKSNPLTISPMTGFSEIAETFITTRFNYLYVTDHGNFLGAVSLHDIKNYLNTPELAKVVIAGDLLRDSFPLVRANASLIEALDRFSHHDGERLPVVSHDRHLVGSIAKTDVILALAGSTVRSATTTSPPASR